MTDQTTPEPLTAEETLPLSSSDQARRLLAEIDRLRAHRDQLHTEALRLGISLAEAIHERHQLRTDLAGAERYRTAALAVAADLTDDLAEARAEIERRDVRWDELVEEKNRLIEDSEDLRAQLAAANRLRCCVCDTSLGYTNYIRQQFCGPCANGETPAQEPATATPAPDPDSSEGPDPTGRPEGTYEAYEAPCPDCRTADLNDPAPLTLAGAAGALHDWAGDLDDGARTDWPAGHPDVIRGIRAAADWLDARDRYEQQAREQAAAKAAAPTLRDVIRTMRSIGVHLRPVGDTSDYSDDRTWDLTDTYTDQIGTISHETHYWGERWTAAFGYERGPEVSVSAATLEPAEILTAARLAGLIGDTDA